MQPRMPFAFFAAIAQCRLMVNTRTPRSCSAELLSSWIVPSMNADSLHKKIVLLKHCFWKLKPHFHLPLSTLGLLGVFLKTAKRIQLKCCWRQLSPDQGEKSDGILGAQKLAHVLANPTDNSLLSAIHTAVGENIKNFQILFIKLARKLVRGKKKPSAAPFSQLMWDTMVAKNTCSFTGGSEVLE